MGMGDKKKYLAHGPTKSSAKPEMGRRKAIRGKSTMINDLIDPLRLGIEKGDEKIIFLVVAGEIALTSHIP